MATVSTVTAVWTGFSGAPGYSRFNFFELADAAACNAAGAAVKAFFQALTNNLMTGWSVGVQAVVQHKDMLTGVLTGETTMTTPPTATAGIGSAATAYAGGSGTVVNWVTGAFWQGRKVRGRTFLVPLISIYSADGTVTPTFISTLTTAGNALVADPTTTLGVWTKRFDGASPPNQVAGALFPVTGASVPDRAAQLRSRRS